MVNTLFDVCKSKIDRMTEAGTGSLTWSSTKRSRRLLLFHRMFNKECDFRTATGAMDADWTEIGSNGGAWAAFLRFHPVSPISHLSGPRTGDFATRATNSGDFVTRVTNLGDVGAVVISITLLKLIGKLILFDFSRISSHVTS
jgi:hypothetical protein